jgi:predicted dehydrogenase
MDSDARAAREVQRTFPAARVSTSVDELLASKVSAVAVLTPPSTHAGIALAAIRAGKHVLIEKPVAVEPAEALAIASAAADRGVIAAAGHNLRFHRMIGRALQVLRSGALGELIAISTVWNSPSEGRAAWQRDRQQGGGVLFDLGVHHLDLFHYFTGDELAELHPTTLSQGADDVAASVSGHSVGGVLFSAVWSKTGGESHIVRLSGTRGSIEFSLYRANSWRFTPAGSSGLAGYLHEAREYMSQLPDIVSAMRSGGDMAESYRCEWLDFASAVKNARPASCPVEQVIPSIAACRRLLPRSTAPALPSRPELDQPRLSVILSVKERWDLVRRTVRRLRAQTCREHIELVLVTVGAAVQIPDAEVAGFHSVRQIPAPAGASVAQANAAGIRAASSPIVALAEDHCFPEPDWAAALIDAHARGFAAVGPEIANANPGSVVSWCDYLIGYGPWMSPCRPACVPFLPGHNSSYRRTLLLEYGDRLEAMLESETVMHFDLARRGYSLYLEPAARAAHVNFAQWGVWIPVQYHCGRVFAGSRATNWSLPRKLFYGFASPLIPLVRAARICRELVQPGRPKQRLPKLLPALLFGLAMDGLGQMIGYLAGPGESAGRLADYEYDRLRFVRPEDRQDLERMDAAAGA